ncbi:Rho GTPase-activating protein 6 [Liparis tanakae]|uniref:Rho GTPase-activating protein 6 n=1 Tax=Liparis tanakae TaxID=230148 RepID=A0A4Z2ECY0_9TELE|nr:Rho GTPase-activating protein 6 [Liparis tanakae]
MKKVEGGAHQQGHGRVMHGDFTWNSVSGRNVGLKPVPLHSLSELERVRLQDVAFRRMLRNRDPGYHITIPKCTEATTHTSSPLPYSHA